MKWLFSLLLVGNVLFFAWNLWFPVVSQPPFAAPLSRQPDTAGLRLLAELPVPPPRRVASAESPAGGNSAAEAGVCLRVNGLGSESEAREIVEEAQRAGATITDSGSDTLEQHRFWVLIPPAKTETAAAPVLALLQRRGIRDYYLVRTGENRNAISLGVFAGRQAAESRYRQIERLGLDPRLEQISLPATVFWVEAAWPESAGAQQWKKVLAEQGMSVESMRCTSNGH